MNIVFISDQLVRVFRKKDKPVRNDYPVHENQVKTLRFEASCHCTSNFFMHLYHWSLSIIILFVNVERHLLINVTLAKYCIPQKVP